MARIEVFEGTWEEISAHAEALKGRRLRLIVLPDVAIATAGTPDETVLRKKAIRLFAEADHLERTPHQTLQDSHKNAFGDTIIDKYQKMGLKL